jgi:hypothetical protein
MPRRITQYLQCLLREALDIEEVVKQSIFAVSDHFAHGRCI